MEKINFDPYLATLLLKLNRYPLWIDLDKEADVLYISFEKPQNADDSIIKKDGNIYHYRKKYLVGITMLNASKKYKKQ
jgi:uncharacterized protein YuzE